VGSGGRGGVGFISLSLNNNKGAIYLPFKLAYFPGECAVGHNANTSDW